MQQNDDRNLILIAILLTFLVVLILWSLFDFLFRDPNSIPTGLVRYGGSTAWARIRKEVDPEIKKVWPQYELRYVNPPRGRGIPSSGIGISMLLDGELDFSQSSRPINDEEYERAKERGVSLEQIPIATDGMAIVVNHSLNVSGISQDQFCSIYAGKITNWKQVEGIDRKVQPYLKPGQKNPFCSKASQNIDHIQWIDSTTEALRKVAADPGGIYWSSASLLVPQCTVKPLPVRTSNALVYPYKQPLISQDKCNNKNHNQVDTAVFLKSNEDRYPLIRTLSVIIKKDGKFAQKSGEAYAEFMKTETAKELIQRAGMEPIN